MSRLSRLLSLLWVLLPVSVLGQANSPISSIPTSEVMALILQGNAKISEGDWNGTLPFYQQAEKLARERNDLAGIAVALNNTGNAYLNTNRPEKAIPLFQQALVLRKQVQNDNSKAILLANLAKCCAMLDRWVEARQYYQQALPLYAMQDTDRAAAIQGLGSVHFRMGETVQALERYQEAASFFAGRGDANEAATLSTLGNAYRRIGQFQNALTAYQKSIRVYRDLSSPEQVMLLALLGDVSLEMKQPDTANDYFQQSLHLAEKQQSKTQIAVALFSLARSFYASGQSARALNLYRRVLPMVREQNNLFAEATVLNNIGAALERLGHRKEAIVSYRQSLPLFEKVNDIAQRAITLSNIGSALFYLGKYSEALPLHQQGLELSRQVEDKQSQALTLVEIGATLLALHKPNQALAAYRDALNLIEALRENILSADSRQQFLSESLAAFMAVTHLEKPRAPAKAFADVQKMKARTLLDRSLGGRVSFLGIPQSEQTLLIALRRECDSLNLAVMSSSRKNNTEQLTQLKDELRKTERKLNTEQERLLALNPGSAQKNVAKTVTLDAVPKFLSTDTALLEFAEVRIKVVEKGKKKTHDYSLLFVVTVEKGKPILTAHTLPMTRAELTERAGSLRDACADPQKGYKIAARDLAAKLLPPLVLKRLAGKRRLVLCPNGAVWGVPFAALVLPDGKHLLERFELTYAYSATGAQAALTVPRGKANGRMLALANPDFGDETRFGDIKPLALMANTGGKRNRPLWEPARAVVTERGGIVPLPGTQLEANALVKLYPDAVLLTGKTAQEAELVKALPKYRYLHFATHGLFSDVAPLQSAIVLAVPPKDSPDDGFLTAREIYDMTLHAEMAVLSACETARGVNKDGEGMIGLTWALFAAGVPTQVVSQWKVSDASTPQLMTAFYSNLKSGQGKGRALQNAAKSMLRDSNHAHPYHWAAFVLFGDWR